MSFNRKTAVEAVQEVLAKHRPHEARRLERIHRALMPWSQQDALARVDIRNELKLQQMPGDYSHPLHGLARKSDTNFLPLILDTFSQMVKVENVLSGGDDGDRDTDPSFEFFLKNRGHAIQSGIHRATFKYGVSYVECLPRLRPTGGPDRRFVKWRGISPRCMTALFGESEPFGWGESGPADRDWPLYAVETDNSHITLFDEERVHFLGAQRVPRTATGWTGEYTSEDNFEYISSYEHGMEVCPIVTFRDRWLLDYEYENSMGIIEPLINLQDRIHETTFEMLVAQYYGAFKQRYIVGWWPGSKDDALEQTVKDTWIFRDKDVKPGQFDETKLDGFLESKRSSLRDMSAIGQVPIWAMGVDGVSNVSDAALTSLFQSADNKTLELKTSLGESWKQLHRTSAYIVGDAESATDLGMEMKFHDFSAKQFAQVVDGLGKLRQMLDVPAEELWEDIPGWGKERVDRARASASLRDSVMDLGRIGVEDENSGVRAAGEPAGGEAEGER